jgi:pantothenate kinase type III
MLSPDATALLALAEDVVALDVSMYEVHEHGHTRTIVSTERGAIGIPVSRSLPDLVGSDLTMHCVNVSDEQGFAACDAVVDVQIACPIHRCE